MDRYDQSDVVPSCRNIGHDLTRRDLLGQSDGQDAQSGAQAKSLASLGSRRRASSVVSRISSPSGSLPMT